MFDMLLEAHVGAESALGDHEIGGAKREQVGDERVVPVSDVRERTGVDDRRDALERLDQVRLQRVLQKNRHRAGGAEILRRYGAPSNVRPTLIAPETDAELQKSPADREDPHRLRGRGDVEAGLVGHAVGRRPSPTTIRPQRSVVHVECAPPGDRARVDAERVAVEDVRVDHRGEQIRGRADGVDVAGEVEVQILHGHDLRPATACAASFDPEDRAHGGLAQADDGAAPARAKPSDEADRRLSSSPRPAGSA